MSCTPIDLGNGARAIVCTRGRRPLPKCSVPGCERLAPKLCDFPVAADGTRRRLPRKSKTCDARLCGGHAVAQGPDRDYCPAHDKLAKSAPVLPGVDP